MAEWMDKHFNGVADPPKKLRPQPEEDRGRRFGFFLSLLIIIPIGTVAGAWWLGYLDPVIRTIVEVRQPPVEQRPQPERIPAPTLTYEARQQPEQRTISQARANELKRLIASRENGLDLMARDRAKSASRASAAQAQLDDSIARMKWLERNRPNHNDTRAVYEWNNSHAAAVAAGKNATAEIAAQRKVLDSFDRRIAAATKERDDAKSELDGAVIIP